MMRATLGLVVMLLGACGGDDGGTVQHDAAKVFMDGKVFMDAPPGPTLTVKNYLSWCSVKVNGAATGSTAATIAVPVTAGVIPITATAASASFKIDANMWHHTDGDTGNGDTGTVTGSESAVTATVSASGKCVWVCCPFTNGTGCAGVADQCL